MSATSTSTVATVESTTTSDASNSTQTPEACPALDPCAADPSVDYVLWQNVSSIFIVLVISGVGTMTAILLGNRSRQNKNNRKLLAAIRIMKYFGVGVILCTAWIHILPDAFGSLTDPCLTSQPGWGDYGALAGVFGIGATFIVQAIEFAILARTGALREPVERLPDINETERRMGGETPGDTAEGDAAPEDQHHHHHHHLEAISSGKATERCETLESVVDASTNERSGSMTQSTNLDDIHELGHQHCSVAHPVGGGQVKVKDISTLSLELGIVVHSVVIGLTLGVSSGDEWLSLLIAICFHQLFEGIALGTLISELNHIRELGKRIGLGLAYPITTPVGTAIGIGLHLAYSSQAVSLLIVKGVLNSLAAGILFYNSYVELLALEVNHSKVFHRMSAVMKGCSFLAIYVGAACMAILAIWA